MQAVAITGYIVVTLRKDEKIQAYLASFHLYADPDRTEPLL
jgi:hypothetical protein